MEAISPFVVENVGTNPPMMFGLKSTSHPPIIQEYTRHKIQTNSYDTMLNPLPETPLLMVSTKQ